MLPEAKLLHKTYTNHLPTNLPVLFFGLPDGKIYLIYARFYEKNFENSGLEFVLAKHREFFYDYDTEKVIVSVPAKSKKVVKYENLDKPDPDIKIIKVYRNVKSYDETVQKLNKKVAKQIKKNRNN